MSLSDFANRYGRMDNDQLLRLWADREALIPEAAVALENELHKRGLNAEDALRLKKRAEALAASEWEAPSAEDAALADYERNMENFVGPEEPDFYSPYYGKDFRKIFAYFRHKYRVWKMFRDHTGHWPVLSIWFHFLSWIAFFALFVPILLSVRDWPRDLTAIWMRLATLGVGWLLWALQELGARLMRKLDWKRCGESPKLI